MRVPATPTEDHHAAFRRCLSTANQAFPQFYSCFLEFWPVLCRFLQLCCSFLASRRSATLRIAAAEAAPPSPSAADSATLRVAPPHENTAPPPSQTPASLPSPDQAPHQSPSASACRVPRPDAPPEIPWATGSIVRGLHPR